MTYNNLFQNEDGANHQAKAVRAYLAVHDGISESWSDEHKRCMAEPTLSRWENCREQGYVICLRGQPGPKLRQINIVFYEHRNSDDICALVFEQWTINAPTIDTLPPGVFKDKYQVSHTEPYGNAMQMADWIYEQLVDFWKATA